MRRPPSLFPALLLVLLTGACAQATEIVLVVDTDLEVPSELSRVEIDVLNSMASPTRTEVDLTSAGAPPLPLTLGITSRVRGDADVRVEVRGYLVSGEVLVRDVSTRLTPNSSRMLRVLLSRRCVGVSCGTAETCDETGCRPVEVAPEELPGWPGSVTRIDGPACEPEDEVCNLIDDDCDGATDEAIVLLTDAENCGRCGHACTSGACTNGFCDGEAPATIAAGGAHTCVVRESGDVACFGWNAEGQLGSSSLMVVPVPLAVAGLSDVTTIAPGGAFTCALDVRNAVSCAGDGDDGALGRGDLLDGRTFAPVMGGGAFSHLAAGPRHACAIDTATEVQCWGEGALGQTGSAGTTSVPSVVGGATGATAIAVGLSHSCAIVGGGVMCWGSHARGQLGNAATTALSSSVPVPVDGLSGVTALAAGRDFTCALLSDGAVWCWGANDMGQLGAVTPLSSSVAPVAVTALSGATAITAAPGGTHACALRMGGVVSCWGGNLSGQLGNGTTDASTSPVDVAGTTGAIAVAAGGLSNDGRGHTCVVIDTGEVRCAGDGFLGQTGASDLAPVRTGAAPVPGLP